MDAWVVGKAKEQVVEEKEAAAEVEEAVEQVVEAEEVVVEVEEQVVLHQKPHLPPDAAPLAVEEMVQGAMAHP